MKKTKQTKKKPLPLSLDWWSTPVTMTRWEMTWQFAVIVFFATILGEIIGQ